MALVAGEEFGQSANTLISHTPMSNFTRPLVWYAGAGLICSLAVLGVVKLVGQLYLSSGRRESPALIPPLVLVLSFLLVAIVCFVVLWFATTKAGCRISVLSVISIGAVASIFGVSSVLIGRPPYQQFLDGFAYCVTTKINEGDAIAWADQIFADSKLRWTGEPVFRLRQDKVPAFFSSVVSLK